MTMTSHASILDKCIEPCDISRWYMKTFWRLFVHFWPLYCIIFRLLYCLHCIKVSVAFQRTLCSRVIEEFISKHKTDKLNGSAEAWPPLTLTLREDVRVEVVHSVRASWRQEAELSAVNRGQRVNGERERDLSERHLHVSKGQSARVLPVQL